MRALKALLVVASFGVSCAGVPAQAPAPFPLDEVTVAQLQQWMRDGRYTSRQLTDLYLQRIEAVDRRGPALRSVIEVNPEATAIADALDRERRDKGPRARCTGFRS